MNLRFQYTKLLSDLKQSFKKNEFSQEFQSYVNSNFISAKCSYNRNKFYQHNKFYWHFSFIELLIKKRKNIKQFVDSFNIEVQKFNNIKDVNNLSLIDGQESIQEIWEKYYMLKTRCEIPN